jgi:hypothetical protein
MGIDNLPNAPQQTSDSDLSGQTIQAPQDAAPQQSLQLQPAQPTVAAPATPPVVATSSNKNLHAFVGRILGALSGGDATSYQVNDSGAMVGTPVKLSTAQKVERIAQNALVGLAAGGQTRRQASGGADALAGLGAGATAVIGQRAGQDAEARTQAAQDFDRKQKQIIQQRDTVVGNLQLYNSLRHMHQEDLDRDETYKIGTDFAKAAEAEGIKVQRVNEQQLGEMFHKDPSQLIREGRIVPVGEREIPGSGVEAVLAGKQAEPNYEHLYAIVDNSQPNQTVKLPQSMIDAMAKYGKYSTSYPNDGEKAAKITPDTPVPFSTFIQLHNAIQDGHQEVMKGEAKPSFGLSPDDNKTLIKINSRTGEPLKDENGAYMKATPEEVQSLKKSIADTAKSEAETRKADAEAGKAGAETQKIKADADFSQTTDIFGNKPTLDKKEMLKREDTFQKDVVNKAYDTEKSFQMANQAYGEYLKAKGHLPTGAQSMLMLSNHLSTTFGNVKGSRVTKDMIQEHLGARGVSDTALTAVQRLTNGDQLSPDQWKAFNDLIGQSRDITWNNAISSAKNQGIRLNFLPRGNGRSTVDAHTAKLYLDAADGDRAKAEAALKTQGWLIPSN